MPAPRPTGRPEDHFVVIPGCSGDGNSTPRAELSRRGHAVVAEPGRRIVQEEGCAGEAALIARIGPVGLHPAVSYNGRSSSILDQICPRSLMISLRCVMSANTTESQA